MFGWLKKFLQWPDRGINNISELGTYIKDYWWKLLIFIVVLIVAIWVIVKILKIIISLVRGK